MSAAGAEERFLPIGQLARGRVRCEIGAQPLNRARIRVASADVLTFTVEHDDVPSAEFVAVVTILGISGGRAEVIEVGRPARGVEFVIACGWPRSRFHMTPCLVVALEIFYAAVGIG